MTERTDEQKRIEAEVNATIKLLMVSMEQLAALDPVHASHPVIFNKLRNQVIRQVWNLAKECIRHGTRGV